MTDQLQAPTEDLRRHARHVDAVISGLDMAQQAGVTTEPGPESYGRLCTMVPVMLSQLQKPLLEAMGTASRSVRTSADSLIEAADLYEAGDEANAAEILDSGGGR